MTTLPASPLLSIQHLSVTYRTRDATIPAVRNLSVDLHDGEVLALVGESAAGKSSVAHATLGLLPPGTTVQGAVYYRGRNLMTLTPPQLRELSGNHIAMIFQDALAALTPTLSIGDQLSELFETHQRLPKRQAYAAALQVLAQVLPDPGRVATAYPFELSGGMAQRVMVAMATALQPDLVIADEATSSLDAATRLDVLGRLESLRDGGTGVLLITHDLGIVARLADRVAVMYAGELVETGDARTLFRHARHPYTFALLESLPRIDRVTALTPMRGQPPDLAALGEGCPFLPRCSKAVSRCRVEPAPPLAPADTGGEGHTVACYNPVVADR